VRIELAAVFRGGGREGGGEGELRKAEMPGCVITEGVEADFRQDFRRGGEM